MDDIKTSIRCWEGCKWGGGVSLNPGTLTLHAGASPVADISIDIRPHKTSSDEFLGGSDSWMR